MATRKKINTNEATIEANEEYNEVDMEVSSSDLDSTSTNGPSPLVAGSFALYEMKDGGMHLVYRLIGSDQDVHQDFPAFVVKMAMQAAEGKGPLGHLNKMIGR